MHAVLLDFNGTMFFDTRFHMEAWSEIYHELHPEDPNPLDPKLICGPCNESIIQNMAHGSMPMSESNVRSGKRNCIAGCAGEILTVYTS